MNNPATLKEYADAMAAALDEILSECFTCACGDCYECDNKDDWERLVDSYKEEHQ
jgi:hypothetical protein